MDARVPPHTCTAGRFSGCAVSDMLDYSPVRAQSDLEPTVRKFFDSAGFNCRTCKYYNTYMCPFRKERDIIISSFEILRKVEDIDS
jgi:hypothetical protein